MRFSSATSSGVTSTLALSAFRARAHSSGLLARDVLVAAGLKPGDEVIVPAYTFEASAAPVLRLGAVPVFVDVLPDSYCLDPAAAEAAVTPKTRAVLPLHLAMCMADLDALLALAARHGLRVIEDCAHAHGAKWKGKGAGSLGHAGAFSLQTTKLLTAGEAGSSRRATTRSRSGRRATRTAGGRAGPTASATASSATTTA